MMNIFKKSEKNSIRNLLLKVYVALLIIPMLVCNGILIWQTYGIEYEDVSNIQEKILENIEIRIKNYIHNIENELNLMIVKNNILNQDITQQKKLMSLILSFHDEFNKATYNELILLDINGKEKVRASRVNVYLDEKPGDMSNADEFRIPQKTGTPYYSSVFFNNETGEPSINIGFPIFDIQSKTILSIFIAEIRLKNLWNLIERFNIDYKDNIYILDSKNKVIAHNNRSIVLKRTIFKPPVKNGIQRGLNGINVFISSKKIVLGNQDIYIIIERPIYEAFKMVLKIFLIFFLLVIIGALMHILLGIFITRKIINPIESLALTALAIKSGELNVKADEANTSEFKVLGITFNKMTSQLIETIDSLKQRINERDKAAHEFENAHKRFLAVLDGLDAIVDVVDMETHEILFINKYAQKIFGSVEGKKCWKIFQNKKSGPCEFCNNNELLDGKSEHGESIIWEYQNQINKKWYYTQDKIIHWVNDKNVRLTIATDITERKNLEETIKHQAYHDTLTGLPNRMLFLDHLFLNIARAQRNKNKLAIFFLDLDRFKSINDSLGHTIGDTLLKEVAKRLTKCERACDIVSRIGGDEFNILLEDINNIDDAASNAGRILQAFNEPFIINENELYISTSIGICIYPDDGNCIEDLMRNADIAMYHAKEKGRNNFQFYSSSMNLKITEKVILRNNLHQASERGELVLYYQPQVNILTNKIVGAEALIRWNHPKLGLLLPKDFLYAAEETGFVKFIDTFVLNKACEQNKIWQESGLLPIRVTVNLSVAQFHRPDLADLVINALKLSSLNPEYLNLEITENVVLRNLELTMPNIIKLNKIGVRFFIDDFGIGYSSLNWLRKFHIQKLKIDKSFVDDITTNPDSKAIITAIIAMAHNMKIKVIAEGVETEEQLEYLRLIECDEIQGYLISKPLSVEEFKKLIIL